MITIERRVVGVLPYKTIYFPAQSKIQGIIEGLTATEMTSCLYTPIDLEPNYRTVSQNRNSTVWLDLSKSLETLWEAMRATCRNEIRRAEKLRDRITIRYNGVQATRDFLTLFGDLERLNKKVSLFNASRRLDLLRGNVGTFVLYFDGCPQCGHAVLQDIEARRARLLYSANRRLQEPNRAALFGYLNRYLHWHEIQHYRRQGFHMYDLGGIHQNIPGITHFKMSFGGAVVHEFSYLCAGSRVLTQAAKGFEFLTAHLSGWQKRGRYPASFPSFPAVC